MRPVHFVVATPLSAAAASLILPLILPLRLAVSVRSRGAFVGAGTTRFAWASKAAKRCRLKTSSGCARFVLACCGLRRPHTAGSNLQLLPLRIELQLSRRLQQQRGGRPRRRLQNAAPAQQSHQCSRTPPRSGGGAGPPHSCQMTGALVRMTRRRTAAKPPGLRLQSVPPSHLAPAELATAHETGRTPQLNSKRQAQGSALKTLGAPPPPQHAALCRSPKGSRSPIAARPFRRCLLPVLLSAPQRQPCGRSQREPIAQPPALTPGALPRRTMRMAAWRLWSVMTMAVSMALESGCFSCYNARMSEMSVWLSRGGLVRTTLEIHNVWLPQTHSQS